MTFTTPLVLRGPLRKPAQMLQEQEYGGHASVHDDATAEKLGLRGAPIEGPTHFSLYPPLMERIWGKDWFERGCISAHYQNMVVEGEETQAFVEWPEPGAMTTKAWVVKGDGTPVHEASASIGPGETLLEKRLKELRPPGKLVIMQDLKVGMKIEEDKPIRMDPDQNMGALYPFSLSEKLAKITENSPWYSDPKSSPWGRAIIPLEMISVLAQYSSRTSGKESAFPTRGPALGLFVDQQIRVIDSPLFVSEDYLVSREIVALSESKRVENCWVRTKLFDRTGKRPVAEMLLNQGSFKESYKGYNEERARLEAAS
ncbi:MAG: hypothetical protein Q8R02_07315 [Hyphomonadaceae bacterium]|nr:hypothetical protein [Hyphomonadaceae bacterium]